MAAVQTPARHRAIFYDQPGQLGTKVVEVDTPKPGFGDVTVQMTPLESVVAT
jgi:alcohol dehydrogenase, propanol-preferring